MSAWGGTQPAARGEEDGTYADCRILSIPFGPSVLFTKSPTAMAPTKALRRAFSPFSSVVPSSKICVGLKDDCNTKTVSGACNSGVQRAGRTYHGDGLAKQESR